jgi:alanine-glyoxylate transaminase/serine-glyoxylate transaminase/serine-pyruvate transaminase
VTLSARAAVALTRRLRPVQSWYLDPSLIRDDWGASRAYHHTAPIDLLHGLHEALRLTLEGGLDAREARHCVVVALSATLRHLGHAASVDLVEALRAMP